ncbi:MAG: ethanolamine ammonia-lyase subunit EutC [Hydrogenophaga sp.]|nr:ethanolamine ammonia-lyase subunit EutC [Hydrogenophaga sp.]
MSRAPVTPSAWDGLRRFTDARIALGRAGHSLPTAAHLAFQQAHAQARDAVHAALDIPTLASDLEALGLTVLPGHSAATDRPCYLQRPDLGRRLDGATRERLSAVRGARADLCLVLADGLSPQAVARHAPALLGELLPRLRSDPRPWTLAPAVIVAQGRVAVGDEVGELLGADLVVVLIGERPGLSSPDSLGIYFTWAPRVGRSDAERNCISNVRDAGLAPGRAAATLHALMRQARERQLTGIGLKDETDPGSVGATGNGTYLSGR